MGRSPMESGSARLMNCKGVNGEPFVEGEDRIDKGEWPVGVDKAKEGMNGNDGSGVRGGLGGDLISAASSKVEELIHLSS